MDAWKVKPSRLLLAQLSGVCSQKSAVRDFAEPRWEKQVCQAEREAGKRVQKENPSCSRLRSFLPLSRLLLIHSSVFSFLIYCLLSSI